MATRKPKGRHPKPASRIMAPASADPEANDSRIYPSAKPLIGQSTKQKVVAKGRKTGK